MTRGAIERRELSHDGRRISYLVKGVDGPTTLYLHGLGADAAQTRPLSSGVHGRGVLVDLPSHGQSSNLADRIDYETLVGIARVIALREGTTRALGVSLGSAVLLRWLTTHADLTHAVLYLPAAVTEPRPAGRLRSALYGTPADLEAYVGAELPASIASSTLAQSWLADRARALGRSGVSAYADLLEGQPPVRDPSRARESETRLLAIGALGDRVHPAAAAEHAGALFAHGRSHIFAEAAPLWTARRELRALISGFFAGSDTV